MVERDNLRVGRKVEVYATGSGNVVEGTVLKLYETYALVEYKLPPNPYHDGKQGVLREGYQYMDILKVVN